jgi:hypothetical protein
MYINGVFNAPTLTNTGTLADFTPPTTYRIGGYSSLGNQRYYKGRIRVFSLINRVATVKEIRQSFLLGTMNGIAASYEFILNVDFNQTGTNELSVSQGTFVTGEIISVADNGSGAPRFTINGTTAKSPPTTGTLIIISGTTDYDTATTGVAITRISDTQFDIPSQTFTATKTGTFRVRITATGGAAYTNFMTP